MSIWINGHWAANTHQFPDEGSFETAQRNLEELKDSVLDAIEASINDAHGDGDLMLAALTEKLRLIPRCPITTTDAYGIALQSIEDIGSYDFDTNTFTLRDTGWQGYESHAEGVDNHTLYHAARPQECGQQCPSQIVYAIEA